MDECKSIGSKIMSVLTFLSGVLFFSMIALAMAAVIYGVFRDKEKFWYPVQHISVNSSSFKGEVYKMEHSVGWRSWAFYQDIKTRKEIMLGSDAALTILDTWHNDISPSTVEELDMVQKKFVIRGDVK